MMFASPDTVIPDQYNALDWNRYLYSRGNPLKYVDSSGHWPEISWRINTQEIAKRITNSVLQFTSLSDKGMTTSDVANVLSTSGTILDVSAGVLDAFAVGAVIAVTAIGAPMAGPEVSYPAGELMVQPILFLGNVLATEATLFTAGSEILNGNLGLDLTVQADAKNLVVNGELSIGTGTAIGGFTTGIGWVPGVPSWGSLGLQSIAIANDFGVAQSIGLLESTNIKIPINYSSRKPTNDLYLPLIDK